VVYADRLIEGDVERVHAAVFVGVLSEAALVAYVWGKLPIVAQVMAVSCLVACAGAGLMAAGRAKLGSRLVVGGSLVFVPLGFLAVWGAVRTLDGAEERAFAARREGR
jgi:hypothetical protein